VGAFCFILLISIKNISSFVCFPPRPLFFSVHICCNSKTLACHAWLGNVPILLACPASSSSWPLSRRTLPFLQKRNSPHICRGFRQCRPHFLLVVGATKRKGPLRSRLAISLAESSCESRWLSEKFLCWSVLAQPLP
jgi:hypothetical protein